MNVATMTAQELLGQLSSETRALVLEEAEKNMSAEHKVIISREMICIFKGTAMIESFDADLDCSKIYPGYSHGVLIDEADAIMEANGWGWEDELDWDDANKVYKGIAVRI